MDDITERILNCLLELGIVFEQEENNFELTDYIEDSLTFENKYNIPVYITDVMLKSLDYLNNYVFLENEFDIEIPDEYLLQGVLGTLNDLKNIITLLVGK